jgi:hypothetical protein
MKGYCFMEIEGKEKILVLVDLLGKLARKK